MKRLLVLISIPNLSIYWQCKCTKYTQSVHVVYWLNCNTFVYSWTFAEGVRSLQCKFYSLYVFVRIYHSNNNTNFINKTIFCLTDLLLSENSLRSTLYLHFFFEILNTFVLIIKQLLIHLQLIIILSFHNIYSEALLYRVGHYSWVV